MFFYFCSYNPKHPWEPVVTQLGFLALIAEKKMGNKYFLIYVHTLRFYTKTKPRQQLSFGG